VNTTALTTNSSISAVEDTTFLLVGKLSKVASSNYNLMDLFVNPSTLIEPTPDATRSAAFGVGTVSFFTLRTVTLNTGDRYDFDALRIGTTYLDVVGEMPVPEPSTFSIAAVGLVLPLGQ
jgi:hypothetical protein